MIISIRSDCLFVWPGTDGVSSPRDSSQRKELVCQLTDGWNEERICHQGLEADRGRGSLRCVRARCLFKYL